MFEKGNKYGNFLTILLIIIIIAVIGLIGYFSYDVYKNYVTEHDADEFVSNFNQEITPTDTTLVTGEIDLTEEQENSLNNVEQIQGETSSSTTNSSTKRQTYKGFEIIGTIEIPTIDLSYPIIATPSDSAIKVAVAMLYGPGPNQVGNTVIIGHNYRNGQLFSNNKKLTIGDKIYITDLNGQRLAYTIYDKFETEPNNSDFIVRNTNGAREISLQTCTDDGNYRLIILAKCDADK